VFKVPDFTDDEGIVYSDIEVVMESDGDVRETARLAGKVENALEKSAPPRRKPQSRQE